MSRKEIMLGNEAIARGLVEAGCEVAAAYPGTPSSEILPAVAHWADELGTRTVSVPKDGLYARYRMNTDLDEVARDPRVRDVDFFRGLSKTKVESPIGPTYTPNFYYAISTARLVMLAPSRALRSRLPKELSPLEVAPGLGLASVMFFRYDVCDIDFYTEAAVGIPVRPARHRGLLPHARNPRARRPAGRSWSPARPCRRKA